MSLHSPIGPSAAHRWIECPGAPAMEVGRPDKASAYAIEGSVAHYVAAACLTEGVDADKYLGVTVVVDNGQWDVDQDMVDNVNVYLRTLRYTYGFDRNGDKVCLTETEVPFGAALRLPGDHKGTVDALIIGDGEIQVHDLKYGRGVEVEAYDNPQLMLYALGALEEYLGLVEFDRVRLVIHQPRLDAISEHVMHVAELIGPWATKVTAAATTALALLEDKTSLRDHLRPGEEQCRWCKAKAICPALQGTVGEYVGQDVTVADFQAGVFPETTGASTDDLANAFRNLGLIRMWCDSVEQETRVRLEHGKPVPGFKLVAGRAGARKWSDADEVEKILRDSMRYPHDVIYKQTLHNPTQIEKALVDSPRRWAKLEAFVTRAESAPLIVAESDKRPALAPVTFSET